MSKAKAPSGNGSASGRLDLLGGFAEHYGALILDVLTQASVQVQIAERRDPKIQIAGPDLKKPLTFPSRLLKDLASAQTSLPQARKQIAQLKFPAPYDLAASCLVGFARQTGWSHEAGLDLALSTSPSDTCVLGDRAAVGIATLRSLSELTRWTFEGLAIAHLAHWAETELAGDSTALAGFLSVALGRSGTVMPIRCRPDEVLVPCALPQGVIVVGWPTGVSINPRIDQRAHCAARMGKHIAEKHLKRSWAYLSEIRPSFQSQAIFNILPESLTGSAFQEKFGTLNGTTPRSRPKSAEKYPVRAAASFPIEENWRAELALALLEAPHSRARRDWLELLGEILLQSHVAQKAMGVESREADTMLHAFMAVGPDQGLYGARLTREGTQPILICLLEKSALPELIDLTKKVCFSKSGPPALLV